MLELLKTIPPDMPVLIAGPTASGKSALALALAEAAGGVIVNADALQVYDSWRLLTARPSAAEEARAPHRLYGHVARDAAYSVGHWLREVAPLLAGPERPIIVGGTGLYFTALTDGLAEIPPTPPEIRAEADALRAAAGIDALLAELDADDRGPDRPAQPGPGPARLGSAARHRPRPCRLAGRHRRRRCCRSIAPRRWWSRSGRDWLGARIDARFDAMIAAGALDEVRAELPYWDPARPSARAIGAPELVAHLRGETTLDAAVAAAKTATRQYAKRQRTWFRNRMRGWRATTLP